MSSPSIPIQQNAPAPAPAPAAAALIPTTSTTTSDDAFDMFEFRRSRSNSANKLSGVIDLAYQDMPNADQPLLDCIEQLRIEIERNDDYDYDYDDYKVHTILLHNNLLQSVSPNLALFSHLETLDMSSNQLFNLGKDIGRMKNLRNLILKDNHLEDNHLSKELAGLTKLKVINLSGNCLTQFPYQLFEMTRLQEIYLGSNKIAALPNTSQWHDKLSATLEILYLGGNQLQLIPDELCKLRSLTSLNLSGNQLEQLPIAMAKMKNIKNLALHGNNLATLPVELVRLNIEELSLRNNPLVSRFAKEYTHALPSLLELSGRVIKSNKQIIAYKDVAGLGLPSNLVKYLDSAQSCVNPKCKGVYFSTKVEHVKFVDFCGKFRVPLMQYLCSSSCNEKVVASAGLPLPSCCSDSNCPTSASSSSGSDAEEDTQAPMLKKILIG